MASVPFNNLITFSRGSNATLTGSNGLIQWAPNNLVTNSEQFDNAAWTKSNSTVTANAAVAPDGTSTADKLVEAATTSSHYVLQAPTVTATTHVFSVYAKAGERSFVSLGFDGLNVWFNLTTGAVGTIEAGLTAAIVSVGDGWYRCSAIRTVTVAGSKSSVIYSASADNALSYTGNGTSGIFIWGAQLELGSAATTYNSTTVKNLLGFSEAFDNAAWTKSNASIVTGAQANPVNGAFNAQKLMENTAASVGHYILQSPTAIAGTAYTTVIYAKAAERNWLHIFEDSGGSIYGFFNLSTGATGAVNNATASITNIGSGWYRCSLTYTQIGTIARIRYGVTTGNAVFTYTGDGNSGVYIYGAQLSDSASLDPYVPTPAAAPSSTAYYGPRFDYDPVTLAPKGLLVEEQRTNLALYSEQFDNGYWTKSNATVTANATTSPDGTVDADALIEDTANNVHAVSSGPTISASTTYTATVYAKRGAGVRDVFIQFNLSGGTAGAGFAWFNLGNGTASAVTTLSGTFVGVSAKTTPTGNGWYRCEMVFTSNAGNTGGAFYVSVYNANRSYTGDGTSGIFIYGAQLEAGAFATSYIPTVASTVTRSADVATINGSLFSQWYNATQGTFVADFDVIWSGNAPASMGVIGLDASASKRFAYISNGSQNASTFDGTLAFGTANNIGSAVNKVVSAYDTSRYIALNGGAVATGTLAAGYSSGTSLDIGKYGASNVINGHIRSVNFIPARAADFQLQALST